MRTTCGSTTSGWRCRTSNVRKRNIKQRRTKPLVVERLEMVPKSLFRKYIPRIADLIGDSHGIYALYDGPDLYYVGKSTDLQRRVGAHLRDRHLASWTHFSLYLVRNADHLHDIESLVVRIAKPKGNRATPGGKGISALLRKLLAWHRERYLEEKAELSGRTRYHEPRPDSPGRKAAQTRAALKGLVSGRAALYHRYRGKEYQAYLSPSGTVTLNGKRYESPTAAAKAVTGGSSGNGWRFWYIKDSAGEWVTLSEYRA